jgi:hypothetical protein
LRTSAYGSLGLLRCFSLLFSGIGSIDVYCDGFLMRLPIRSCPLIVLPPCDQSSHHIICISRRLSVISFPFSSSPAMLSVPTGIVQRSFGLEWIVISVASLDPLQASQMAGPDYSPPVLSTTSVIQQFAVCLRSLLFRSQGLLLLLV